MNFKSFLAQRIAQIYGPAGRVAGQKNRPGGPSSGPRKKMPGGPGAGRLLGPPIPWNYQVSTFYNKILKIVLWLFSISNGIHNVLSEPKGCKHLRRRAPEGKEEGGFEKVEK